ncbi:MAG TPA: hypothetical protein VEF04_17275, partial [Blastocatellia bacterium]|nr:hypothetical protein [Blastocatellia bacterium]
MLNRLGIQPLRSAVARTIFELLPYKADSSINEKVTELHREGIVLWHDFLPNDLFEEVRQESIRLIDENADKRKVINAGPNLYEVAEINQ